MGFSTPSFVGKPTIWLKQQYPIVAISFLLCSWIFHIRNGLFLNLLDNKARLLDCFWCSCSWLFETRFLRSLNVNLIFYTKVVKNSFCVLERLLKWVYNNIMSMWLNIGLILVDNRCLIIILKVHSISVHPYHSH